MSRFSLGKVSATSGVQEALIAGRLTADLLGTLLSRHGRGDWGDLDKHDRSVNEDNVATGGRVFSAYKVAPDLTIWIVTEGDRATTTLLLPSEY